MFTELAGYSRVGTNHAVVDIGSRHQPFTHFVPEVDSPAGQAVLALLDSRYITTDDAHVRRSYAYVHGTLRLFRGAPQMTVTSTDQITDSP